MDIGRGWGTWDPRRVLGLHHLVGSHVVLTQWAASCGGTGDGPVRALGLLSSGSEPKGLGTHTSHPLVYSFM